MEELLLIDPSLKLNIVKQPNNGVILLGLRIELELNIDLFLEFSDRFGEEVFEVLFGVVDESVGGLCEVLVDVFEG